MPSSRQRVVEVYVTFANRGEAKQIATTLVKDHLAACVNIWPISSVYNWKGKIVHDREVAALMKTTQRQYTQLEKRIRSLHSYELPCIVSWQIERGLSSYLRWVERTANHDLT